MDQLCATSRSPLIGDGQQPSCFTHVDDPIEATIVARTKHGPDGEVFSIGTDVETSILDGS